MKRFHPIPNCVATCAIIALAVALNGCRSSSTGIAGSPFLAPDRVPPPSTRLLQPGQAQPYYQGDPLPAMQSALTPGSNQPGTNVPPALASDPASRTASGRTLAWSQPINNAVAPQAGGQQIVPQPAAPQPAALPQPAMPTSPAIAATEGAVAVPQDADPLRYTPGAALRDSNTPPGAQLVAAQSNGFQSVVPQANQLPTAVQQPLAPPQPIALAAPGQGVQLASYTTPAPPPTAPMYAASLQQLPPPPQQVDSPWRSPQIAASRSPLALPAPAASPLAPATVSIPPNTVAATLRPVDSPALSDPIPRVRMPGYIDPQLTSADGFRPRSSMQ